MKNIKFAFPFRDTKYYTLVFKIDASLPIHFIACFEDSELMKEFNIALFIQNNPTGNIAPADSTFGDDRILREILLPMIKERNDQGLFELQK